MTGKNARQNAFLRLVSSKVEVSESASRYLLLPEKEMVIGRDPTCQIVLDAMIYRMVSRRHAVVRPLSLATNSGYSWVICDLNSANGTFLNGEHLKGCQELHIGDRISLGADGPQFIFEYEVITQRTMINVNNATVLSSVNYQHLSSKPDSVSFTQLFQLSLLVRILPARLT